MSVTLLPQISYSVVTKHMESILEGVQIIYHSKINYIKILAYP